jgi:rSAM/selenodomain-associated transferase 2
MTTLSVVIAAWQEAELIAGAVRAAAHIGDEVIVADAASPDGTGAIARRAGARVVSSSQGRGRQLHAGALVARGDTLLFLHADARLAPGARDAIEAALADPQVAGGNFYLRFTPETRAARFFSWANDARRRWLDIYYGDSALFLRASAYRELGGFRPLPILEDYELVRRLQRAHRTAYVRDVAVAASARRFEHAPLRTLLSWALIQALYGAGVPAERLAGLYPDLRGRDLPARARRAVKGAAR